MKEFNLAQGEHIQTRLSQLVGMKALEAVFPDNHNPFYPAREMEITSENVNEILRTDKYLASENEIDNAEGQHVDIFGKQDVHLFVKQRNTPSSSVERAKLTAAEYAINKVFSLRCEIVQQNSTESDIWEVLFSPDSPPFAARFKDLEEARYKDDAIHGEFWYLTKDWYETIDFDDIRNVQNVLGPEKIHVLNNDELRVLYNALADSKFSMLRADQYP